MSTPGSFGAPSAMMSRRGRGLYTGGMTVSGATLGDQIGQGECYNNAIIRPELSQGAIGDQVDRKSH